MRAVDPFRSRVTRDFLWSLHLVVEESIARRPSAVNRSVWAMLEAEDLDRQYPCRPRRRRRRGHRLRDVLRLPAAPRGARLADTRRAFDGTPGAPGLHQAGVAADARAGRPAARPGDWTDLGAVPQPADARARRAALYRWGSCSIKDQASATCQRWRGKSSTLFPMRPAPPQNGPVREDHQCDHGHGKQCDRQRRRNAVAATAA